MREEALLLGPARLNIGVFTPAASATDGPSKVAFICITAGLLHHVGPHRMHVLLARSLSRLGISTLRFDLSGIGDSAPRADDLPAQEIPIREINDSISELEARGFERFILFGICSGALHATLVAVGNPKITGLVLVNTGTDEGHTEVNPADAAQFYLKRSLWNPKAWKNFFTGRVKYRQLFATLLAALVHGLKGRDKASNSLEASLRAGVESFIQQGTSVLMVLSDRHAGFYEIYRKTFARLECEKFKTLVYPETDHLFTSLGAQQELIDRVCRWSSELVEVSA